MQDLQFSIFVYGFQSFILAHDKRAINNCIISAGVGRTGAYIAVDYLLEHFKKHGDCDIYGLVYKMRLQRMLMVQTEVSEKSGPGKRYFTTARLNVVVCAHIYSY